MKSILTSIVLFLTLSTWANMASPIQEGTMGASPFISQNVDIIKENILIIPGINFETCQFIIEYHIQADITGTQIPLLFYAPEYAKGFKIKLDDIEIQLSPVPERYHNLEGNPFSNFDHFFEAYNKDEAGYTELKDSPIPGFYVTIDDLKFFEVDLLEGVHVIQVEYVAERWIDRSDWVKEYSFRYALAPAKYWRSFGDLEVTIDASNPQNKYITNLGEPETGNPLSKATWTFSELPVEVLQITYKPELSSTAQRLISMSPVGLTIIFAIFLIIVHLVLMWIFRRNNPDKKYSWLVIAGSIIIPFITLIGYMYSFSIIDSAIGPDASHFHGYTFIILLLYPVIVPVYWTIMWLVDRMMKLKTQTP